MGTLHGRLMVDKMPILTDEEIVKAIVNLDSSLKRIVAAKDEEHVFLNPTILKRSGTQEAEEGCLSLPEIYADVKRSAKIVFSAYNLAGQEMRYELTGLFARAVQHEYDHLDGVLFIDRLSETGKLAVQDAVEALEREFADERNRGRIPDDQQIAAQIAELESLRT